MVEVIKKLEVRIEQKVKERIGPLADRMDEMISVLSDIERKTADKKQLKEKARDLADDISRKLLDRREEVIRAVEFPSYKIEPYQLKAPKSQRPMKYTRNSYRPTTYPMTLR